MAKKDPTNEGTNRNSYSGSEMTRAAFDEEQAGAPVPYYPEFESLDSSFSVGINQRNYLGPKDHAPGGRRIERATAEGLRNLS